MKKATTIDDAQKRAFLKKILESRQFKNSDTYSELLTYLVESAIMNETPKEITIALDVFKKKSDFDANVDSSIRQHVYYLREKLKKYYQTEGKQDKIKIELSKGHYKIRFVKRPILKNNILKHQHSILYALLSLIIIFLAFKVFQSNRQSDPPNTHSTFAESLIWSDILTSQLPNLIVLGNHFFYKEYQPDINDTVRVRNFHINSIDDLNKIKDKNGRKKEIEISPEIYFSESCIWCLPKIIPLFTDSGQHYQLKQNSKVVIDDITNNNILFVGDFKTLGLLGKVLTDVLNIDILPLRIYTDNSKQVTEKVFDYPGNSFDFHKDYCLFLKIPGPGDNHIMVITSNHRTGMNGVAEYITNAASLKDFETTLAEQYDNPKYFISIFEVSGYEMTNYKADIVFFKKIESASDLWR